MPTIKPMLAKEPKYIDGVPQIPFPVCVQPKLDGVRAMVIDGKLMSRSLKRIPNAEIREALERPEFEGLDGELIVGDPTAPDCYRKSSSFVMSADKTGADWYFMIFDRWDTNDTFEQRQMLLQEFRRLHRVWFQSPGRCTVVPTLIASDGAELERMETVLLDQGHEGVIARAPHASYKFGRSTPGGGPLWKIKRFFDFEAEVIGAYEENHNANEAKVNELGRTERSSHAAGKIGKGRLGGLYLRAVNGPYEGVEFKCGTGFDAEQRETYWHPGAGLAPALFCRTAKIKCFLIGAKDKPRFPVFLGWRDLSVDG